VDILPPLLKGAFLRTGDHTAPVFENPPGHMAQGRGSVVRLDVGVAFAREGVDLQRE